MQTKHLCAIQKPTNYEFAKPDDIMYALFFTFN